MKVKICGIQTKADVDACRQADILGFVTEYPEPVRWNMDRERAKALVDYAGKTKTCIVTGGDVEKILSLGLYIRPDYIQLHYKETAEAAERICRALLPYDIRVIKTLPQSPGDRELQFGTADVEKCVDMLNSSHVHSILIDSRSHENAAKGGGLADFSLYKKVAGYSRKPVFLAGGITPSNLGDVITAVHPEYIDVMTGAENGTGRKDESKVEKLLYIARSHDFSSGHRKHQ